MGWKHEQVVPAEMDRKKYMQRMALRNHIERYKVAQAWLREHFNNRTPHILDLACGTGFGSEILATLGSVVGVDIEPEGIEYAKKYYGKSNIRYIVGNADDADFLESLGAFDAVVSLETLEHLADHRSYLKWVRQALTSGGAVVVSFPQTFTMDWGIPHHKRDISRRAAARLFQECGFKTVERFTQSDRLPMHHMIKEARTNRDVPAPPFTQWAMYYLKRPDHMLRRLHQITMGGGILLAHQQYMLVPPEESHQRQ